jgi:spore coat polysaccharide biosynthesis protein SpsF
VKTGIFVQARSGSVRFPGKVFERIPEGYGPSMIEHIYKRLTGVKGADVVSVLIPDRDTALHDFCISRNIEVFRGPELDVRERYRLAARHYGTDLVVRATGDNPCVDPKIAGETIAFIQSLPDLDLFSFANLPLGTAVEAVRAESLFDDRIPAHPDHTEHVTLHIKQNPRLFRIFHERYPFMNRFANAPLRLTVDEPDDLDVVRTLFGDIGEGCDVREIMRHYTLHPERFRKNSHVIQRVFATA